jgi:hypothetical protein
METKFFAENTQWMYGEAGLAGMLPSKRLHERVHPGDIAVFYYQIIAFKG